MLLYRKDIVNIINKIISRFDMFRLVSKESKLQYLLKIVLKFKTASIVTVLSTGFYRYCFIFASFKIWI